MSHVMIYTKHLAQGLPGKMPQIMTCGLSWLHMVCTCKFPHITGEPSVSARCLCMWMVVNREEENCITSKRKAKWRQG